MPGRFEGRVALVTGGASGIGRATALAFAGEGARVIVADVSPEGGGETARLVREAGGEAMFIQADMSKASEVEGLLNRIAEAYGRLDCAFNNAGVEGSGGTTLQWTEEDWDRVMAVNFKGVWLCMKYEIPLMLQGGRGAIVNTASVAGVTATPYSAPYGASKAGVIHLTRSVALEYAKRGIRINAVCPGFTRTSMVERMVEAGRFAQSGIEALHPMGRLAEPAEIAQAVLWLCSDSASFVTGHPLFVDGGFAAR